MDGCRHHSGNFLTGFFKPVLYETAFDRKCSCHSPLLLYRSSWLLLLLLLIIHASFIVLFISLKKILLYNRSVVVANTAGKGGCLSPPQNRRTGGYAENP